MGLRNFAFMIRTQISNVYFSAHGKNLLLQGIEPMAAGREAKMPRTFNFGIEIVA